MKNLAKFLAIGIVVAIALFLYQRKPLPEKKNPLPEIVTSPRQTASENKFSPRDVTAGIQPRPSRETTSPFDDHLASILLKLHRWLDAKNAGTDDNGASEMKELLAMLTDENAAEIIKLLSTEELESPFGFAAIHHWMHVDPVEASNWMAARRETTKNQTWAVAKSWTDDPAGLQDYLDLTPNTAWKQSLLQELGAQLLQKDPMGAVKLSQKMNPGSDQLNFLKSVASDWTSRDPNSAIEWIMSVEDPPLREQLIVSSAQSYALTEPELAAAWLVSVVKSEPAVKAAALNITETWLVKNPGAAAAWVAQFPEGDMKKAAVDIVTNYWQQIDRNAAIAWRQKLGK